MKLTSCLGFPRILAPILALVAVFGLQSAHADIYKLQPGDVVRVAISGLPEVAVDSQVGVDGDLRFPQVGRIRAVGRTIDEVEAALRAAASGRAFRRFNPAGEASFVTVNADDIFASILTYRPVYVSGDVAAPGALEFRPGLTVRAAMAAAGGAARTPAAMRGAAGDLTTAPRLQSDYQVLVLERARLQAQLWRIRSSLGEDAPEPMAEDLRVAPQTAQDILDLQRRQQQAADAQVASTRAFLAIATLQADDRLEILRKQEQQQALAVKDDEEEMGRVSSLFDRGIVPIARLLEIRRAQLASSTRLLQTQNDLERVALERARFDSDLNMLDIVRRKELLAEYEAVRARLAEVTTRLTAARDLLELNGLLTLDLGAATAPLTVMTIHRVGEEGPRSIVVSAEETLEPGDVLEIAVIIDNPLAVQ